MTDYLTYSVRVSDRVVTVDRSGHSWPIGKITSLGKLRLWSKKTSLFLDEDDQTKILDGKDGPVGSFVVRVINSKDSATLHVYTNTEFYSPAIATWSKENNSLRFGQLAHPLFKKDRKALVTLVTRTRSSGLFSSQDPLPVINGGSIFDMV